MLVHQGRRGHLCGGAKRESKWFAAGARVFNNKEGLPLALCENDPSAQSWRLRGVPSSRLLRASTLSRAEAFYQEEGPPSLHGMCLYD